MQLEIRVAPNFALSLPWFLAIGVVVVVVADSKQTFTFRSGKRVQ